MPQLGCQTILFGRRPPLLRMLDAIANAGFVGVEFFQHPDDLGRPDTVRRELERRGLEPVMLAGKTPLDRKIAFARAVGIPFLYTKGRDLDRIEEVEAAGLRFALHPHLGAPIERLADAESILVRHRNLVFTPDFAHLAAVGDDPVEAIRHNADRIVSVHVKDWVAGWWGHNRFTGRFGFREPGAGALPLDRYLRVLRETGYDGWLTLEVERRPRGSSRADVLRRAREWFRAGGL